MRFNLKGVALCFLFLSGYALIFPSFEEARRSLRREEVKGMTLPPPIVRLLSLEFRGLSADLFFARASQFYGGKVDSLASVTKEDWEWLHRNLEIATELDPWFSDPYYMGNAMLTWDAGMFVEANRLLQKATDARGWDWIFPFYLGFNKFYFLGDQKGGADDLLLASKRPGAWELLPTLAARLYYQEGRTENAIVFLMAFRDNEPDERVRKLYSERIEALQGISILERAVKAYRERRGSLPADLETLVREGFIESIPQDPYGGRFYLDPERGRVRATSKLAHKKN